MRFMIVLCLAALHGLIVGAVSAQSEPAGAGSTQPSAANSFEFLETVEAYRSGRYDLALLGFAGQAAKEPDAARRALLHANAGTAAARADRLGEAIWHLEAACRGLPGDIVAQRNLDLVRVQVGQGESETDQFLSSLLSLPLLLSADAWNQLVGAAVALGLVLLALWRARRAGPRVAWLALALLLLAGALHQGAAVARAHDARRAVVITPVAVRAEPAPEGKLLFRLDEGTVVSDEEQRGAWRLLETSAGGRGWAPAGKVRSAGS